MDSWSGMHAVSITPCRAVILTSSRTRVVDACKWQEQSWIISSCRVVSVGFGAHRKSMTTLSVCNVPLSTTSYSVPRVAAFGTSRSCEGNWRNVKTELGKILGIKGSISNNDRGAILTVNGARLTGCSHKLRRLCNCASKCIRESMQRGTVAAMAVKGEDSTVGAAVSMAVDAKNITLSLNAVPVLKSCSLQVPEGQLWMLLGPNGCGKSTLLKVLAGLLRPGGGRLRVVGPRSFVFQNPDHQVVMPTAGADVAFGLGTRGLPEDEVKRRVDESLEAVGMGGYSLRPVQTLSGGQKQRVAIAGALAEDSRLLLLDELTTFLDESDQFGVLEAVRKVIGGPKKVTALWVTHRLEELPYADGAIYMEDGRVVISGTPLEVAKHIGMLQDRALKSFR